MKQPGKPWGERKSTIIVAAISVTLIVGSFGPVWSMEPPRPGEIQQLRAARELEGRLAFAEEIGNHRVDVSLVERMKYKLEQIRGYESFAPPSNWQGMPTTGDVRTFMLLIEFQDFGHATSQATIDSMLYGAGNPAQYPRESLANYFDRSSYGLLDLSNGATLGWYQTAYNRSAVVETYVGREALISEALDAYEAAGHDFSVYDNDGDGDIDYFMVMWTGPNTGWGSFWWGYQTGWADSSYTLDGKTLGKYSWQWESSSPVVVIHETGHGLGLPDLYDYDGSVGPDGGVGGFDMMHSNRYDHNSFSKWLLEWLAPSIASGPRQSWTLDPTATDQDAVMVWPGAGPGDIFSEFYMVQNRQSVGNDDIGFLPNGLAVWHIDATLNSAGTDYQFNNSFTSHKLVRLMEADGLEEIEAGQPADASDLYGEGDRISQLTTPASDRYDGTDSCVTVCGIEDLGNDAAIMASISAECSQPPTCSAGGPYVQECEGTSTMVSLIGTADDPDAGEPMDYLWTTDCPGGVLDDETSLTPVLTVDSVPGCVTCNVTLAVTDCAGNETSSSSQISIVDTTPPAIFCNAPPTTTPNAAPISFTATATDTCDSDPARGITTYNCYKYTKRGRYISKLESCIVTVDGDTITILDTGGVGDHIEWTVDAVDDCGNPQQVVCELEVVNPSL